MPSCKWEGNNLYYLKNNGKKDLVARISLKGKFFSLETFHNGGTYFVGIGKSATLDENEETYWSRVNNTTYLIHYNPDTGSTMVKPDRAVNAVITKK